MVLLARRAFGVALSRDQPALLEPFEAIREDVAGNALGRGEEVGEPPLVVQEEIPDDEERPAIADEVERAGNGAARPQRAAAARTGAQRLFHAASLAQTCKMQLSGLDCPANVTCILQVT